MGYDYYLGGGIIVRPPVPADRLAGTPFVVRTDDTEIPNEEEPFVVTTVDGSDFSTIESACPDGLSTCGPLGATADDVAQTLNKLVELIGPGHTYSDSLHLDGSENVGDQMRIRLVRRPVDDGPDHWTAVTEQAELVYPDDYAIPDGPAVTFNPARLRAWLAERLDNGNARAYELGINPDAMFDPDEDSAAFLAIVALEDLMNNKAPEDVWKAADGVNAMVIETVACDGPERDGGAVLRVDVGGERLVSPFLDAGDLVHIDRAVLETNTVPQDEIAAQALTVMATEINDMVEQHRRAVATAAAQHTVWNLGPLAGQLGPQDIETALRTLAEIVVERKGQLAYYPPSNDLVASREAVANRLAGFLIAEG